VKEVFEKQWITFKKLKTFIIDEADKFCFTPTSGTNGKRASYFLEDLSFLIGMSRQANPHLAAFSATFT
jgi:superfamily II DNA/RNA helicase